MPYIWVTFRNMLTSKKQAFCIEYILDFNGHAAAIRAGYAKSRARITASELLSETEVSAEIKRLIDNRKEKVDVSVDEIISELKSVAFAKTTDYIKIKEVTVMEGRKRKRVKMVYAETTDSIDEVKQRAIAEIKQTKDGIGLKSHDKVKALELLGRYKGIFEKDNKQKAPKINFGDMPITFE